MLYELKRRELIATIYLSQIMIFQLFCSMCSAFVLQILKSAVETNHAKISEKYSGLINFGEFKVRAIEVAFLCI